ncbi:MAG: sigma-54 dependent transcriptional regulator [Deltaproteobacteria bacterium]
MEILLVDDEVGPRRVLARILESVEQPVIHQAASLAEARACVNARPIDVAFIDIRLDAEDPGNRDGLTFASELRGRAIAIMVTHISEMATIRQAMQHGAFDYVLKDSLDIRNKDLFQQILRALRQVLSLEREVVRLRTRLSADQLPWTLVGTSVAMDRLRRAVQRVALSDQPVLINGPSGSGKEPVARAVHAWGGHPDEPFVSINCSAIPEALFESELFGHERGAFTGADRRREGYLANAGEGSLFLDEVAELPAGLQAKLLRVLETRQFRPVGGNEERTFRGRIIAATHSDLAARTQQGRFRADLLYRLDVLPLRVPSLQERTEDIPLLVVHFAQKQAPHLRFSPEALEALRSWTWPGNVRQLRNVVQRLAVFCDDEVVTIASLAALPDLGDVPVPALQAAEQSIVALAERMLELPLGGIDRLQTFEDAAIAVAMRRCDNVKTRAASLLGVHRKRVERRVDRSEGDGS